MALAVPVHFLDVHRLYGQLVTALHPAGLQDFAPVPGLHSLAETVYAQAAALFRLPCALDHDWINPPKNSKPRYRGSQVKTSGLYDRVKRKYSARKEEGQGSSERS